MLNINSMDFTDSSFDYLSLPSTDLNIVCFPSQGPLYCPRLLNFSRMIKKCQCHFYWGLCKLSWFFCLKIFLVLESICTFQRSCMFKSYFWNKIREMSIFESIFKIKFFWSKTQYTTFNTCSPLNVLYFENINWPVIRLK